MVGTSWMFILESKSPLNFNENHSHHRLADMLSNSLKSVFITDSKKQHIGLYFYQTRHCTQSVYQCSNNWQHHHSNEINLAFWTWIHPLIASKMQNSNLKSHLFSVIYWRVQNFGLDENHINDSSSDSSYFHSHDYLFLLQNH